VRRIRLGVTRVSDFECPRRPILAALLTQAGLTEEIAMSPAMLQGLMLHSILQSTFHRYFDYVKFFCMRKGLPVAESIEKTCEFLLQPLIGLTTSHAFADLGKKSIVNAISKTEDMLHNLGEVAATAVWTDGHEIESLAVSDEYELVVDLTDSIMLTGSVDFLLYRQNKLVVVELKTGEEYPSDVCQLQIYGDMMAVSHDWHSLELELWYPKRRTVRRVEHPRGAALAYLKGALGNIPNIQSRNDLPPETAQSRNCTYCGFCDKIDFLFDRP